MSIKADVQNLLTQLNYPINSATTKQLNDIAQNTPKFYDFAKHLFALNDDLKKFDAIVAMSNTHNYLKLKCDSKIEDEVSQFKTSIHDWAQKYKVSLKQVENKNTFYILGKD